MGVFNWGWGVLALGLCFFFKLQDNFKMSTHSTATGRDQSHNEEEVRIGKKIREEIKIKREKGIMREKKEFNNIKCRFLFK